MKEQKKIKIIATRQFQLVKKSDDKITKRIVTVGETIELPLDKAKELIYSQKATSNLNAKPVSFRAAKAKRDAQTAKDTGIEQALSEALKRINVLEKAVKK